MLVCYDQWYTKSSLLGFFSFVMLFLFLLYYIIFYTKKTILVLPLKATSIFYIYHMLRLWKKGEYQLCAINWYCNNIFFICYKMNYNKLLCFNHYLILLIICFNLEAELEHNTFIFTPNSRLKHLKEIIKS